MEQEAQVFVSHSSKDQDLVGALVRLLQTGLTIAPDRIFCSSLPGHRIPFGEDFRVFIRQKLTDAGIVIALITGHYRASPFCMHELGAAWALAKRTVLLICPPLTLNDIPGAVGNLQAAVINSPQDLDEIRDQFGTGALSAWNHCKTAFLSELNFGARQN